MARRRTYAVKKRTASLPYRGRKGSILTDIFSVGGKTHRVKSTRGGGSRGIIADQTGIDWWGKRRGR